MRAPMSWIRQYVDVPADQTGRDVSARLIAAGLEVETVEVLGAEVTGPLVVASMEAVTLMSDGPGPLSLRIAWVCSLSGRVPRHYRRRLPSLTRSDKRSPRECQAPSRQTSIN